MPTKNFELYTPSGGFRRVVVSVELQDRIEHKFSFCAIDRAVAIFAPPADNAEPVFVGSGRTFATDPGSDSGVFRLDSPAIGYHGTYKAFLEKKVVPRKGRVYICPAGYTEAAYSGPVY